MLKMRQTYLLSPSDDYAGWHLCLHRFPSIISEPFCLQLRPGRFFLFLNWLWERPAPPFSSHELLPESTSDLSRGNVDQRRSWEWDWLPRCDVAAVRSNSQAMPHFTNWRLLSMLGVIAFIEALEHDHLLMFNKGLIPARLLLPRVSEYFLK